MADNVVLNSGVGGDTIAADDVGGVKYQIVKVAVGADGAASLVSSSNPVPVSDAGATLSIDDGAGSITVDGTVELGSTSLAALESLTTISAVTSITNAVTVAGPAAEDAAASGNPVLIGGRYDSSARTLESGDVGALALNASGQLLVEIAAGAGSGGTSAADGATFTRNTTSITPVGAVVESSAPTLSNGDVAGLSQTTGGALRVAVASGGIAGIAEDTVSAGGEEGVAILAVRRDSASSGVSADGDFAFLSVDSSGNLRTTGSSGITSYTEDGASAGGESLVLVGAVRRDTAASSSTTDGDYSTLNTDASGRLHVNVGALPASTNTIEVVGDAATDAAVSGNPVYIAGRGSNTTPTAMSAQNDVTPFWLTLTGAQVVAGDTIDGAAFTPGTSRVQAVGYHADEASTDSVDEGDLGAARMTLDRKQIVTVQPHTQGGLLVASGSVGATATAVKASAGQLYGWYIYNPNASAVYCQIFNVAAGSVTLGTTAPTYAFAIPATSGANVLNPMGIAHSTAITVAFTTTRTGSTGPGSTVDYSFFYF